MLYVCFFFYTELQAQIELSQLQQSGGLESVIEKNKIDVNWEKFMVCQRADLGYVIRKAIKCKIIEPSIFGSEFDHGATAKKKSKEIFNNKATTITAINQLNGYLYSAVIARAGLISVDAGELLPIAFEVKRFAPFLQKWNHLCAYGARNCTYNSGYALMNFLQAAYDDGMAKGTDISDTAIMLNYSVGRGSVLLRFGSVRF